MIGGRRGLFSYEFPKFDEFPKLDSLVAKFDDVSSLGDFRNDYDVVEV